MAECNSEKIIKNRNSHKQILNSSREEILKTVRVFMVKNKCFTSTAYKKMNFITFPTLKKKLDLKNWQELIDYLHLNREYKIASKRAKKQIVSSTFLKNIVNESNEELLEMYKNFSERIGAVNGASMSQLKKYGFKYSETVLLRRFGSWKTVKEACGYTFNLGSKYSKQDITKLLLKAREEKGRRLSQKEINQNTELPVLETILKFFKTTKVSEVWDELEMGMEKTSTEGKSYTLEEIKELLYNEYLKKGAPLTVSEVEAKTKEKKLPGKTTIYRHFKTTKIKEIWKIVLKEREKVE